MRTLCYVYLVVGALAVNRCENSFSPPPPLPTQIVRSRE